MKKILSVLLLMLTVCTIFIFSASAADSVVYVCDGGAGDGSSAATPVDTLEKATACLPDGGTVVVCGPLSLVNSVCPVYNGEIVITSAYGGVDYRRSAGAKLTFGDKNANPISLGGDTTFDDVIFEVENNRARTITCNGNAVVFGAGVECLRSDASYQWLGITVGSFGNDYAGCDDTRGGSLTIDGGNWQIIRGGNRGAKVTVLGDVKITINGGTIEGNLMGASAAPISGDVYLTINGGEIKGSSTAPSTITPGSSAESTEISGDVHIAINGGKFSNTAITVSRAQGTGGVKGNATVDLNGGAFASTATIGVGAYTGKATLNYSSGAFADISFVNQDGFTVNKIESDATTTVTKPDVQSDYGCARGLYTLGLAQGYDSTGTNFGLADKMTRVQTVVQVIRFLGVEDEVKAGTYTHPFTDVPAWANNYVGYAYANKITSGMSATKFTPDGETSEAQFLTFMLRAVGYSDANGDFVWSDPFALAKSIGMTEKTVASAAFNRGDAFRISWDALYATAKSGSHVYTNLMSVGVFTDADLKNAVNAARASVELQKPVAAELLTAPKEETTEYYVLSKEEYMDKTTAGFLSQIIGFLSDYKYVWNSDGSPRIAMPDSWWLGICRGNDVPNNPYHQKIIKLYYNEETKMWDNWIADAYSIDILGQHILRDMREQYGTFTTKVITDGWVKYAPWDMGGGSRYIGAYALASGKGYISPYLGMAEFGNQYSWCQEPWIGNDGLGMAAAGMPNVALDLTRAFGRVTGDSDNVLWLDFVATMSSMAYFESDIKTLINKAAEIFPEDSYEREVVDMAYELYARYPNNWRHAMIAAEEECARRFYYLHTEKSTNEQGRVEVNFAFMLLALLYGDGDYMDTAKMLSLSGYDTRGTIMLPVLGIIGGMDIIPEEAKAVTWQDGKGVIVNKAVPDTVVGVWMFADGLPEQYTIASVIELYRENFEWILLENGGKIENGNYYIPKTALKTFNAVSVQNGDFESGALESYNKIGAAENTSVTDFAYWGEHAAQVNVGNGEDTGVYTTVSGLKKGSTYKMTAYVLAANNAKAQLFARVPGASAMQTAGVYYQPEFVKRDLVFVAEAETMEIGLMVPAQDSYGYAIVDEITVTRVAEYAVSGVKDVQVVSTATVSNSYTGKIDFAVSGKADGEVYLKVHFANIMGGIVDAAVTVNGDNFRTVPFYKTGDAVTEGSSDYVYIPVVLGKETNVVTLDIGDASLYISSAQVVTTADRLIAE